MPTYLSILEIRKRLPENMGVFQHETILDVFYYLANLMDSVLFFFLACCSVLFVDRYLFCRDGFLYVL